jgi:hypothetical protein
MFHEIFDTVEQSQVFNDFNVLNGHHLIAVDGTTYHNSNMIHCDECYKKYHTKSDLKEYSHIGVSFALCTYRHTNILPIHFSTVNENMTLANKKAKQDTEIKAFKRFIEDKFDTIKHLNPIFLLDAIYGNHPVVSLIDKFPNASYIITCKPGSQRNVTDYVNGATLETKEVIYIDPKTKKKYKDVMSWMTNIPIRNSNDAQLTHYISLDRTFLPNDRQLQALDKKAKIKHKNKSGKDLIETNHFCYITNILPTNDNIEELILCARNRWRIENGFNSLKKRGFHFEHNFGHGKKTLSGVLAVLLLIAYSIYTWSFVLDDLYKAARNKYSSNKSFITTIACLTEYLQFSSFKQLFVFIIEKKRSFKDP